MSGEPLPVEATGATREGRAAATTREPGDLPPELGHRPSAGRSRRMDMTATSLLRSLDRVSAVPAALLVIALGVFLPGVPAFPLHATPSARRLTRVPSTDRAGISGS